MKINPSFFRPLNKPLSDWSGQKIWIVGGSSGIGLAFAKACIKKGAKVALTGRTLEPMRNLEIKYPGKVFVAKADVTIQKDLSDAYTRIAMKLESINMLVYLAALYSPMESSDFDQKMSVETINVNLTGFLNTIALVLPEFNLKRQGRIVIVSSVAGYRGLPNSFVYGATKAALINLAETMFLDMKEKGVGVHLVNPGFVETRLTRKNSFAMPMIIQPHEAAKQIIKGIEIGSFEIHFPKTFTFFLKMMRILPYKLYFYLVEFFTKNN